MIYPPPTDPTTITTSVTTMQEQTQPPVGVSNVPAIAGGTVAAALIVGIVVVLVTVGVMLMR